MATPKRLLTLNSVIRGQRALRLAAVDFSSESTKMHDFNSRTLSFADQHNAHFDAPSQPLPRTIASEYDLDRWRQENAAAALQVGDLEAVRHRSLSSATVEAIRALDDQLVTARVRLERAVAVITAAEQSFAEKAERERAAQPGRRAKHMAALKAHAEAEQLMREVYAPAAAAIANCLARLVEINAEIEAANRDLPEGAEQIAPPDAFRGYPAAADRYVDQDQKYYIDPRTGAEMHPTQYLPKPMAVDPGNSQYGRPTYTKMIELETRTRKVKCLERGHRALVPTALAREVVLPGLMHSDSRMWPRG